MKENFYFDNAATTWPKPEPVYQFMDTFFRSHGVNPGRAGHQLAVEAEAMIVETRQMLAKFFGFGGPSDHVTFSLNASDSLNMAFFGLANPGDHVVITRLEHNSVLRPANHAERDFGIKVTRVAGDAAGYVDPEDIRRAIRPNTRAVFVNHASNVLGALQDIAAIGAVVAETGALFVVDTCQTAGVVPIDMDGLDIDVLVFTGHKGLFGPMGIGGMIVRPGVEIRPSRFGGTGVDSITPFQPDAYPHHLETGTPPVTGIAGLNAAQKWFAALGRERLGDSAADHRQACTAALEHIHTVENGHIAALLRTIADTKNVVAYGPGDNAPRVATLSVNFGEVPADQAGAMLDADFGLCVRAGLHCAPLVHEDRGLVPQHGAVRFSPGYFTDEEDMSVACEAILEMSAYAAR